MNDFIKGILARPVAAVVTVLALIIFGVSTLTSMDLEKSPSVSYPMFFVFASYPGAGPEEVERVVTQKIENACTSLKGYKGLTSSSGDGSAQLTIDYDYGTDLKDAREELQNVLNNVKAELPEGVTPEIMQFSSDDEPVFQACVDTENEDIDAYSVVKQQLEPELKKIDGVADIGIYGGVERYISIELKPDAVAQYGLDVSSVAATISSAPFVAPAGTVSYGDKTINVSTVVTVTNIDQIKNVPIVLASGDVLHLYDVANVRYLDKPASGYYRFDGHDVVNISIKKKQRANVVNLGKDIRAAVERVQKENPDIHIKTTQDNSIPIEKAIQNIFITLGLGVVLSMLVLFLFFGDFKASMIVGSSMPISLLVTFIMMGRMGYSLNLITMSALVIGIGMMVDNAIVVLEMCFVKKDTGLDFRESAFEATKFVFMDIVASTLTSVVVYLPLVNLKGMAGQQFGPLGWTIMFALTASLASALTLVPLAFSRYKPIEKKSLWINKLLAKMGDIYGGFMPFLLRHKIIVAVISIAFMLGSVSMFRMFMFDVSDYSNDYDMVNVNLTFKPGYRLKDTDEVARHFEDFIKEDKNIDYFITSVQPGNVSIMAMLPTNSAVSAEVLGYEWGEALKDYDDRAEVSIGFSFGGGGPSAVVPFSADSYDELKDALARMEEIALNTEGVTAVKNSLRGGGFKADVVIDQEVALSRGFSSTKEIADMISTQLQGRKALDLIVDDRTFEARVELPEEMRSDISSLEAMSFKNKNGLLVPFNEIAHIEYNNMPRSIMRMDGKYSGNITATVGESEIYEIQQKLTNEAKKLNLPKGVKLEESNAALQTREAMSETTMAIAAAVFLVFMVMAIQFESIRYSLLVMICLPFALIGGMPLLYVGVPQRVINLSTMVGLLMLGGMVVNDGIMFVATTNEYRKTMKVNDALILAGKSRMRPILMTTLTTVLSMVPMVIPGAGGDPSMRGLAYVVIGGMTMATLLTLIILPVFYLFVYRRDPGEPGFLFGLPEKRAKKNRGKREQLRIKEKKDIDDIIDIEEIGDDQNKKDTENKKETADKVVEKEDKDVKEAEEKKEPAEKKPAEDKKDAAEKKSAEDKKDAADKKDNKGKKESKVKKKSGDPKDMKDGKDAAEKKDAGAKEDAAEKEEPKA